MTENFLNQLKTAPDKISFEDTISAIDAAYLFTPTAFTNGQTQNEAGQNNGSCKILAFGQINGLTADQTLHCFGDYYRKDVLGNPAGEDHANIRNFITHGWEGVKFSGTPLRKR